MNNKKTDESVVKVVICMGSSCFSQGSNHALTLLQTYLKEKDLEGHVHLEGRLCQGQCQDGPNVTIDGKTYHKVSPSVILDLVKYHLEQKLKV